MPAPHALAALPKPVLFALYGAVGGLLGAVLLGEPAWYLLKPPLAAAPAQLAIGASASVKLYPGASNSFTVRVARERFEGPVAVRVGAVPAGMTLPSITIPPDETQVTVPVTVEANAPPGITRVALTAEAQSGAITASTSVEIEVIALPPALALTVPPNLSVYSRGEGKFTASVARRGYEEELAVRIDGLPAGLTAAPAVIPRGMKEIDVTIKAADAPVSNHPIKLTVTTAATAAGLKTAALPESALKALTATAGTELEVRSPPIAPVDVVFVLDVTASMQWALNDLKKGIGKFAEALSRDQLNFRLGLVTFQDLTIPDEKVEVVLFNGEPFTTDATVFRDKVGQLRAEGGGDIPESSLEGVSKALEMPFRQGASKVLLLITDAPPKVVPEGRRSEAIENVAQKVKTLGIDSLNVVIHQEDREDYRPLQNAGLLKGGGKFFDMKELVRNEEGFEELLTTFGRDVTAAAMSRSVDVKPEVAPPPAPPRVGDVSALTAAEAPPAVLVKGVQASGEFAAGTSGRLTLAIGVWTGAIAALVCLALLAGQHHYLRGQFPSIFRTLAGLLGGLIVGFVGGAAGQGLYMLAPISLFQVLGWMLLGALAGTGLSLFIPNLKWFYGLAGGAVGGAVGGLGYLKVTAVAGDLAGRWVGGLIVGFCIGLMVAIVEAAFRRAWLEVRFGARETIAVNLGPEPVKVGGDAKACTVWARGAAPLALRFFIRDGQVICDDAVMKRENTVGDGFAKEVGNVTVTVRTGTGTTSPATPTRPPTVPQAASPTTKAQPQLLDDFDLLPMAKSPPSGTASKPVVPAAPARPEGGSRPAMPAVPTTAPQSLSRPPIPPSMPALARPTPPSRPSTPPAHGSTKPMIPTPPKAPAPPAPAASSRHPDACPGCGRVNSGKPKMRYCVVCDQTY